MNFIDYLKTSAQQINQEMDFFLKEWNVTVGKTSKELVSLNKLFADSCEGGKRIRGTLVKLGYELAGEKYNSEILKSAAAFEVFQTAILAHDDIIDKSETRRGKPTLYKEIGCDHYGISQTICLGDIGFFLAERLINKSDFPDDRKSEASASFIETMLQTGLGQMLDIKLSNLKSNKNEEDILTVFRLKTARYTLIGPMQLGAILGGADEKLLKKIERFGDI